MDLINNMLHPEPNMRLTIADISGHPWMRGEVADGNAVRLEFQARIQQVNERL